MMVKLFMDIMSGLGQDGGFLLMAGFCTIGFFYILFFVPETKGKTLDEIQRLFEDQIPENTSVNQTTPPRNYNTIL